MKSRVSIILMFATWVAVAQTDSTGLEFSALIDTYYAYDFNQPVSGTRQFSNMAGRHNEFNINQAYLRGAYSGGRVRGELALQTGTYPNLNYAAEPNDLYKMIHRANVGFRVGDRLWIDGGVMGAHFGYESVESVYNEIYSRSIVTEYTPYYQTGIQATYELNDQFTLSAVVVNGWQIIAETNNTKAFGLDVAYTPNEALTLNYGNYFGNEGDAVIGDKFRFHHSFFSKYQISQKWHAALTFDFGTQEDWVTEDNRSYLFVTFITQYMLSDTFSVSGRIEHNNDENEILVATNESLGFQGQIYTLNFNYYVLDNTLVRLEGKMYGFDDQIFDAGETASSSNAMVAISIATVLK